MRFVMLIERMPKLQRYDFRHEAEDDYRGEILSARIHAYCREVYLGTSMSEGI